MSLLALIQDACDLLSLQRPSAVVNSNDVTIRQLHKLAKQEARDLNRLWWKAMTREDTFTTIAAATQTGVMADDFDRFIPNSFYNRSTRRPVIGPVTPQQWQLVQAQPAANRVILAYRVRDGSFLMTPTPPAGQTIAFEYISTKWARNAALSTAYVTWQVDTDTSYFDEWLITLGTIWRWRKSKGLPYAEDYDSYQDYRETLLANDGGSTAISLVGVGGYGVTNPNIPEQGFGA